MKKNKKTKKIVLIILSIVIVIGAILFSLIYVNNSKSGYTLLEKKWISDNKNDAVTIKMDNNIPMFSYSGEGIFYDYINDLSKDTDLNLDVITTNVSDYEFIESNKRNYNNILFYKDHYVVISKLEDDIKTLNDLKGKTMGVLKDEMPAVSYYFKNDGNIVLKSYNNYTQLTNDLGKNIDYIVIPRIKYMEDILNNNYTISYHLDDLNMYYELQVNPNKKHLNSIMKKFYNEWQAKYNKKINEYNLNFYIETKNVDQLSLESITKKDLKVGYMKNIPYEGKIKRKFSGLTSEYLRGFSKLTGATFKYKEYKDNNKLKNDLNKDKIDLMFNYNTVSHINYASTSTIDMPRYVVLVHKTNDIVINNIYGLKDYKVTMLKSVDLTRELKKANIFKIKEEENFKKLSKDIDKNSIIILDSIVYDTYKNSKLKNYTVRLEEDSPANYNVLINKNEKVLNNLFEYYITFNSGKEIAEKASYNTIKDIRNDTIIGFIINNIIILTIILLIVIYVLWKSRKRIKVKKKIKKEDKMMYIDVMTNLKNRNYLNDNMEIWDANKVYPQAVIVIDVDDLKEINDTEGHEEGDRQLKAVANILINTQRENSEIIRSDGNEFLVYMIGYEEKAVTTYMHKLNKEFKNLPYDYGVHFGYSMITNEIKTLDDAINESLAMIKEQENK